MSNGLSDLDRSMPQDRLAAPGFFYSNLRIQETLTTIRYGIEARKGLVVVTGATGAGKSTLLRKAANELAANVTCVFESDPRKSFPDIVRLVLRHLDATPPEQEEEEEGSALLQRCRMELRSRLDQCQIVALFLDNAEQIPDQTIRYIMQNFLAGSPEQPDETLLQVVLAGRRELRAKLSQATMPPSPCPKPIFCETQPLNSGEIAPFIGKALKARNRATESFDERAIKRIALYANGSPGSIVAICERALQLAGESADTSITPEVIENAANELDLRRFGTSTDADAFADSASFSPRGSTPDYEKPKPPKTYVIKEHDVPFSFPGAEEILSGPVFPPNREELASLTRLPRGRPARARRALTVLAFLVLLIGAAGMLGGIDTARDISRHWGKTIYDGAAPYLESPAQTKIPAENPVEQKVEAAPVISVPGPDYPVEMEQAPPAPTNDSPAPSASKQSFADRRPKAASEIARPTNQERGASTKENSSQQRENLQTQVTKAIESRAIIGVEVSVIQGTAYLDGHVASERQRRAAERAARSVAGVERVRNRITLG